MKPLGEVPVNLTTDVVCIGHASYDLIFSVNHHPAADEKTTAQHFLACGGGPAANAAVVIARLGFNAAFSGYLGQDLYGASHAQELVNEGVNTALLVRGAMPTPVSVVWVKPDGQRALVNYKGDTVTLAETEVDYSNISAKAVLFDGHEPHLALKFLQQQPQIPSILDAGSVHAGTLALIDKSQYLVCSEKFAVQYAGDVSAALTRLAELAPVAVITLGEQGLIWQRGAEQGRLNAPTINAVDSTGAGDAFHGAFAAGVAQQLAWQDLLVYASVAGAYCCTQTGARPGMPNQQQHSALAKTFCAHWLAG